MDPILLGVVGFVALIAFKFVVKPGSSSKPTSLAEFVNNYAQPPKVEPWQSQMIADVMNEHHSRKKRAEALEMAREAIEAEQE